MIIVNVLNKKNYKRFSKCFYDHKKAYRFVYKVNSSNDLILMSIERELD